MGCSLVLPQGAAKEQINEMSKEIKVLAADSQDEMERRGAEIEFSFDTVKEAKERAKYYLTEEYRRVSESSRRLGYAQVLVNGTCVADFFGASSNA